MPVGPRMIFDTTGINKLEDGGFTSEPLMKALGCGYEVTLTAMSADEMEVSASDSSKDAETTPNGGNEPPHADTVQEPPPSPSSQNAQQTGSEK